MKFVIVCSEKDEAGMNIYNHLKPFNLEVHLLKEDSVYCENDHPAWKKIKADFIIFATRHKSQQQRKNLSIHAPGNLKQADFGGQPGKLCNTSAFFLKHMFQVLNKEAENSGYDSILEVTHHGPLIDKPCCFIEIGTTISEWQDEKAGEIIARTIKKAIETFSNKKFISAIGIGGPHYAPNFIKIQLNSEYAISHIISEYAFPLTKEMVQEAIEKTTEKTETAIIDWKGMGKSEQKQEIIKILESLNLKVIRTNNIEK